MNLTSTKTKMPLYTTILLSQFVTLFPVFISVVGLHGNQVISVLYYFCMTWATFLLLRYTFSNHLDLDFFQKVFFVWVIYLYIKAVPDIFDAYFNHINLKHFLTEYMFLYAIPLFMITKLNLRFLRKIFAFQYVLLILYLIIAVFFNKWRGEWYTILVEGSIIIIMTWPYHANRKRMLVMVAVILVIIGMMISARRNKVVFFGGGLFLALVINLLTKSDMGITRKISILIVALIFGLGIYLNLDSFSFFFERVETGMESREQIITLFQRDFNSHPSDWVFGRGLYGVFDGGILNTNEELGVRDGIENGYYFLILKGGWLWLGLLILISLKAIYNGLFKSNNLLCKGFAMIILLYYLDMIGYGIPQTSMKYIMVFISIAGCNTEWLRQMSDIQLSKEIGLK